MSREQDRWDAGEASYKSERDTVQSWKVEVTGEPRGAWTSHNGVRLPTRQDAVEYKFDLFCRWTGIGDARVAPSEDPPNYQWVNGRLTPMKPGDVL